MTGDCEDGPDASSGAPVDFDRLERIREGLAADDRFNRIEALEAALERQSSDQSAGSSLEELSARDAPDEAMSIRRRVEEWLTGGF